MRPTGNSYDCTMQAQHAVDGLMITKVYFSMYSRRSRPRRRGKGEKRRKDRKGRSVDEAEASKYLK